MANEDLGTLTLGVETDLDDFEAGITETQKQVDSLAKKQPEIKTGIPEEAERVEQSHQKMQQSAEGVIDHTADIARGLGGAATAYNTYQEVTKAAGAATLNTGARIGQANLQINNFRQTVGGARKKVSGFAKSAKKKLAPAARSVKKGAVKAGQGLKTAGARAGSFAPKAAGAASSGLALKAALGAGVAVAGVAAAGGIAKATSEAGTLERSLAGAAARVDATESTMQAFGKSAKSASLQSAFSANEAARAHRFLAKSGFEAKQSIEALPSVLEGATAAGMGVAEMGEISSNVMKAFSKDASELTGIMDVMVEASTSANTSVQDLGKGLGVVGGLANKAGMGLEETTTLLSVMQDSGIEASRAAIAVRGGISRLLKPTGEAKERLENLGVATKNSEGKFRGLIPVLSELEKAGASNADMLEIFGRRAGPTLQTALADGAEGLEKFEKKLKNSEGTSKRVSDFIESTFTERVNILTGSLETAAANLGETFLPAAKMGVTGLTELTNAANKTISTIKGPFESAIAGGSDLLSDFGAIAKAGLTGGASKKTAAGMARLTNELGVVQSTLSGTAISAEAARGKLDALAIESEQLADKQQAVIEAVKKHGIESEKAQIALTELSAAYNQLEESQEAVVDVGSQVNQALSSIQSTAQTGFIEAFGAEELVATTREWNTALRKGEKVLGSVGKTIQEGLKNNTAAVKIERLKRREIQATSAVREAELQFQRKKLQLQQKSLSEAERQAKIETARARMRKQKLKALREENDAFFERLEKIEQLDKKIKGLDKKIAKGAEKPSGGPNIVTDDQGNLVSESFAQKQRKKDRKQQRKASRRSPPSFRAPGVTDETIKSGEQSVSFAEDMVARSKGEQLTPNQKSMKKNAEMATEFADEMDRATSAILEAAGASEGLKRNVSAGMQAAKGIGGAIGTMAAGGFNPASVVLGGIQGLTSIFSAVGKATKKDKGSDTKTQRNARERDKRLARWIGEETAENMQKHTGDVIVVGSDVGSKRSGGGGTKGLTQQEARSVSRSIERERELNPGAV